MDLTVSWMYAAECNTGGLSAWKDARGWTAAYPEVTGYCLPTLWKWDARDLALRCADWLVSIQNSDGSWNGIDGKARPFDTAAIIEGMLFIWGATKVPTYRASVGKAMAWIDKQVSPEGYLYNSPDNRQPEIYNLRASSIINNKRELDYWRNKPLIGDRQRSHYLAYAIEGALNFADKDFAMPYIELAYHSSNRMMPFYVDKEWNPQYLDYDVCSTAQMGINFERVGLNGEKQYQAVSHHVHNNGGVPQSTTDEREILWAAKFYLDLKEML